MLGNYRFLCVMAVPEKVIRAVVLFVWFSLVFFLGGGRL